VDTASLQIFGASLDRCSAHPDFLDLFYEVFLASSPKVREKFANTNLLKQKAALQASFTLLLETAQREGEAPPVHLENLARRHGASELAVGAELYDLWLDSLLVAVQASDPAWTPEVAAAWERVMGVGIAYLCSRYWP
jgi:hemoglobin-like flavoprotein